MVRFVAFDVTDTDTGARGEAPGVVGEFPPAAGAAPVGEGGLGTGGKLQDDFGIQRRAVETLLTDIVLRLRELWRAGPARCWGSVFTIRELAVEDTDKRIAAAVYEGFVQFSNFLGGLEVLLTQHVKGSADFTRMLRNAEQFVMQDPLYFWRQNDISARQERFKKAADAVGTRDGVVDGGDGTADSGKVHKGSPNVEDGDVGIPDSTLRGNTGAQPDPGKA